MVRIGGLSLIVHRPKLAALAYVIHVFLLLVVHNADGADYDREQKWAAEITPGIVVGDPVYLEGRAGRRFLNIYTEAPNAKAGLVLVHGIGVHPDWGLIGTLRGALADHGYSTLSAQMPVLAQEARPEEYGPTLLAEAGERLKVAVNFLRAKGYKKIAVVSHSMGSRMTHYYLARDPDPPINAWVSIGWGSDGDFGQLKLPVLDLYGENDLPSVLKGAQRRAASINDARRSRQIMAPRADHFFGNQQAELVRYVREFLDTSL